MLGFQSSARIALEYMIIEQVFGGMFQLPCPTVQHGQSLFYGSLLIQLCQDAPNTIPLVLAQATEILFERLDKMKPICIERFVDWFSYHLINYQIQWSWKDWAYATNEDVMSPRRRLLTETLCRLVRFSYYENVRRRLPKQFHFLMPPEPQFNNRYANPDLRLVGSPAFSKVLAAIRSRMEGEDLAELVDKSCVRAIKLNKAETNGSHSISSASPSSRSRCSSTSSVSGTAKDGAKEDIDSEGEEMEVTAVQEEDDGVNGESKMVKQDEPFMAPAPRKRLDDTPHGRSAVSEANSFTLERNKYDDDDDVVNYDGVSAKRREIDARHRIKAKRIVNRPDTDKADPQECGFNRTPSVARNRSPPREPSGVLHVAAMDTGAPIEEDGVPRRHMDRISGVVDINIDVFFSALLFCGHKTISHTFSLIKRYSTVIRRLIPLSKMNLQVQCLHLIRAAWCEHSQMIVMIVDQMCRDGYIEAEAVIRWAYSDEMCSLNTRETSQSAAKPPILELYIWECLNGIIGRVGHRVKNIAQKLENIKDSVALNGSSSSSNSDSSNSDSSDSEAAYARRRRVETAGGGGGGGASVVVSRLQKEQDFLVSTQSECVRTLLRCHCALMHHVESLISANTGRGEEAFCEAMDALVNVLPQETLQNVMFWLRGRLEQILLDHHEQFIQHQPIVDEFLEEKELNTNFYQVMRQWKALYI